jgi:hypothetical protein
MLGVLISFIRKAVNDFLDEIYGTWLPSVFQAHDAYDWRPFLRCRFVIGLPAGWNSIAKE